MTDSNETNDIADQYSSPPFIRWVLGGTIAGILAAAAWAAIAYYTKAEYAWIAIGVGCVVGYGVKAAGSGKHPGFASGAIAATIALLSIAGGKYSATYIMAKDYYAAEQVEPSQVNDEQVLQWLADNIGYARIENGEDINWPSPDINIDNAIWPDDYPADIQQAARDRLDAYSQTEREMYIVMMLALINSTDNDQLLKVTHNAVIDSLNLWDVLFIGLAMITAIGIAATES